MRTYLDFEKPIAELESKIEELSVLGEGDTAVSINEEIANIREKAQLALEETYANLDPWQKTQVARHPERPHTVDYIRELIVDFTPLGGDRYFGEDLAIIGGLGQFHGRTVMIIGHEKGADTQGRLKHNFGMAKPEGYRKAVRLMELANRFSVPVVSLVDTAGAYPGIEAEERGQAEAIARSTDCCLALHRAHDLDHYRRGRLRRRNRHCLREPRAYAGARDLQRDFARRRRLDPVA